MRGHGRRGIPVRGGVWCFVVFSVLPDEEGRGLSGRPYHYGFRALAGRDGMIRA